MSSKLQEKTNFIGDPLVTGCTLSFLQLDANLANGFPGRSVPGRCSDLVGLAQFYASIGSGSALVTQPSGGRGAISVERTLKTRQGFCGHCAFGITSIEIPAPPEFATWIAD